VFSIHEIRKHAGSILFDFFFDSHLADDW